jgi:hypothetical protein
LLEKKGHILESHLAELTVDTDQRELVWHGVAVHSHQR